MSAAHNILANSRWRIDSLERLFLMGSGHESLLRDAISFAEAVLQVLPNADLAWELIALLNTNSRYAPMSIPNELSSLISKLLELNKDDDVLCVGASLVGMSLAISRLVEKVTWENERQDHIAEIILQIAGAHTETKYASLADINRSDIAEQAYSKAVIHAPWGYKVGRDTKDQWSYLGLAIQPTSVESLYIQYALRCANGNVVAIVPPGFLYKTAGTDRDLKRYLVEEGLLAAVIRLPNRLFQATTVAPNLLVLRKNNKNNEVVFVDASGAKFFDEISRSLVALKETDQIVKLAQQCGGAQSCNAVERKELVGNDYNLDVSRYVHAPEKQRLHTHLDNKSIMTLGDIANVTRAQAIKKSTSGCKIYEVNPSDIQDNGYIVGSEKYGLVDDQLLGSIEKQRLRPGDIILAVKGSVGRVALVPESSGEDLYAGQSFVIARLKSNSTVSNPIVLYSYLASAVGQELIRSMVTGATVPMIKMQDILSLPVVVPTVEEQSAIIATHNEIQRLYESKATIEREIMHLKEQPWSQ